MSTSNLHPIIRPAEEYEHPRYPVRDHSKLGPTEDLDREPDDTPDSGIALLALSVVGLAILIFVMLTRNEIDNVAFAIIAVPALVFALTRWTLHKRRGLHPSR